jgi:DNA-binding transcriptional MerR regulator
MPFDPNSTDAMFARVIERLDKQDRSLERIEKALKEHADEQAIKDAAQDNAIEALTVWKTEINAKIVIIALLVSGLGTFFGSIAVAVLSSVLGSK